MERETEQPHLSVPPSPHLCASVALWLDYWPAPWALQIRAINGIL